MASTALPPKRQKCQESQESLPSPHQPKSNAPACWAKGLKLPLVAAEALKKQHGINHLYEWQQECLLRPRVQAGDNLVYTAPTSGGKTLIAEILALRSLLVHKRNVIFVVPYVAIAEEKATSLSALGNVGFYTTCLHRPHACTGRTFVLLVNWRKLRAETCLCVRFLDRLRLILPACDPTLAETGLSRRITRWGSRPARDCDA